MTALPRAFSIVLPTLVALGTFAALGSSVAHAQGVYRSVGPDGKVTFSDRAPAVPAAQAVPALQERTATPDSAGAGAAAGTVLTGLPPALRQAAARFPVALYTSSDCAPCASARSLLQARGVPFSERTVQSNEDIDALQHLSGSTNLPFATIGKQQLSGFADLEWKQYLDAAGYPKQSQLPANYQRPAAAPLVAVQRAETQQRSSAESRPEANVERPRAVPAPTGPAPSNPAGIRF